MRRGAVLSLLAVLSAALLARGGMTCRRAKRKDLVDKPCPVMLKQKDRTGGRVTLEVLIRAEDFELCPRVEVGIHPKSIFVPLLGGKKCPGEVDEHRHESNVSCISYTKQKNHPLKLKSVFEAAALQEVFVSYSTTAMSCNATHRVEDPRPDFSLSVNTSSRTISVSVESEQKVNVRWCYRKNENVCLGSVRPEETTKSAVLSIPYLLPCICVEAYYTHLDAPRRKKCPFQNESLIDVRDALHSSVVSVFNSYLEWESKCPSDDLNVSAALCWRQQKQRCIPVTDSTLQKERGPVQKFGTSGVDKHPQMCVQFFIRGFQRVLCPFVKSIPSWKAHIEAGRRSFWVFVNSSAPAGFSAQLCVLGGQECAPRGTVQSLTKAHTHWINLPVDDVTEKPCVQVWQSDPALTGRMILCPDYTQSRWGVCAAAVLALALVVVFLGCFIHRATKSGSAGWLIIRRPLLLVSSSEQCSHVSATCALASVLQGELGAPVHSALWAQSRAEASVAGLGPLPWLYGQWERVSAAQGKVLIVWSPDAKRTYEKFRAAVAKQPQSKERRADKRDKSVEETCRQLFEVADFSSQKGPSTAAEVVLWAALASLQSALLEGRDREAAIVYFQGLCHSRDIPKAFRGVPRYCLPQDFSGLIQELAEVKRAPSSGQPVWRCWHRLLSKAVSVWLARQLGRKLQTVLPRTGR